MRASLHAFWSTWAKGNALFDSLGRCIDYARISITDRCNLRCVYCMPAGGVAKRAHGDILTFDEISRVCGCFARLGITKLKITGGEPLVRRGTAALIAQLKRLPSIETVTLTTNGHFLAEQSAVLLDAGLDGVNISLDTLDPDLYRELTRGGDIGQALVGIDSALAAGFASVKVNCVPLAEAPGQDLLRVAALARDRHLDVRFIEMMPIGMGKAFHPIGRDRIRRVLELAYGPLSPCDAVRGNGPARYFTLPGFAGTIGFIETLDHSLCSRCNRVRLTADGMLKTCLHMDLGVSLKPALSEARDDALLEAIRGAILAKPRHHRFLDGDAAGGEKRNMSQIGG